MIKVDHDNDLVNRLKAYFTHTAPLRRRESHSQITPPLTNTAQLAAVFERLRDPLSRMRNDACANVWRTAGLGTNEVRISAALAQLWDARLYGLEGRLFLSRCLAQLGSSKAPKVEELASGYRIQAEHCPNGDRADRVDVTIETARSIIGVEIKVYAGEGVRQLTRYIESITRRAALMRKENPQVVYLSARRPEETNGRVTWITWRDVAKAAVLANPATLAGSQIRDFGEFCARLGE